MKKIILNSTFLLVTIALISSCNLLGGEKFPPEPEIEHYTFIWNDSNHYIKIYRYRDGQIVHINKLELDQNLEIYNEIFADPPFFLSWGDSVKVVYDDTLSVWHFENEIQDVSRSVMLPSSYTGGKVNDKLYEIYYTFTDVDYDEAVVLNGGG